MIDEEEYQQFGSESDHEFSLENSALVSGRLRLRPRPVFQMCRHKCDMSAFSSTNPD